MNFPKTLQYCLQYVRVCVHKIMLDSGKVIACYQLICNVITFLEHSVVSTNGHQYCVLMSILLS